MRHMVTLEWMPHPDDDTLDLDLLAAFVREQTGYLGPVMTNSYLGGTPALLERVTVLRNQLADARAESAIYQEVCEAACPMVVGAKLKRGGA